MHYKSLCGYTLTKKLLCSQVKSQRRGINSKQKLFQLWRLKTIVLKGRSRKRWSEKREEKEKKSEGTAETTAFTPWMCNVMSHRGQVRQRRWSLTSSFSFILFCPIYSPGLLLSSQGKQITLKISHSQNILLLPCHCAQNHLHATRKKNHLMATIMTVKCSKSFLFP